MKSLKVASRVAGGLLLLTTVACMGIQGSGIATGNLRVANLSLVTTIDTNMTSLGQTRALSTALPSNETTCSKEFAFVSSPGPTIEITAGGSTTNLLTVTEPLSTDQGTQTLLVYGQSNNLKVELINSMEGAGGMDIFVADLSQTDTSTYQVIIKDLTNNTQTQTTSVSGVDGSRHIVFPVTVASNYEVDLVSGGVLKASGTVNVSSTNQHNIVAFTDNGSNFNSHTINGAVGCVAPPQAAAHKSL